MNQIGKRTRKWLAARRAWIKDNPPDHEGYYLCGICAKPVHYTELNVDHISGRQGDNLVDLSNFQPAHVICNYEKGSSKVAPKVSKTEYELRRTLDL